MKPEKKARLSNLMNKFSEIINDSDDSVSFSDDDGSSLLETCPAKKEVSKKTKMLFQKYVKTPDQPRGKRKIKSKSTKTEQSATVYTVVLLEDINRQTPLSGKEYSEHAEKLLIKEPITICKTLTAEALRTKLQQLFINHLQSVEFDILKKIGDKLLPPTLPTGEKLDGTNFAFIFHRKTVFLRPHTPLCLPADTFSGPSTSTLITSSSNTPSTAGEVSKKEEISSAPVFTIVLLEDSSRDSPLSAKEYSNHGILQLIKEPVPLSRDLSEEQLYNKLRNLFESQLKTTNFTICKKIGAKILPPSLPAGMKLNGDSFSRLFYKKTVYLRPHKSLAQIESNGDDDCEIVESNNDNIAEEDDCVVIEDDNNVVQQENESQINRNDDDDDDNEEYLQNILLESGDTFAVQSIDRGLSDCINVNQYPAAQQYNTETVIENGEEKFRNAVNTLRTSINVGQNKAIKIMRGRVKRSLFEAIKKLEFSPSNGIFFKILDKFGVDEEAIDSGGVSREVFTLAFDEIRTSPMFEGPEFERNLALDNNSKRERDYYYLGVVIAMAIAHNLPLPRFFSSELYSFILSGKYERELKIESIMDLNLKNQIVKVDDCKDLATLQDLVYEFNLPGVSSVKSFNEKRMVVRGNIHCIILVIPESQRVVF